MTGEEFVSGLEKVRRTGTRKWAACCPAHDDSGPSLSVKDDGDRLLVHCFAGCTASEVVEAMGLTLRDLFNGPFDNSYRPSTPLQMHPAAAMRSLLKEAYCVGIIAANMNDFGEISDEDRALLIRCISRMDAIFTSTGADR